MRRLSLNKNQQTCFKTEWKNTILHIQEKFNRYILSNFPKDILENIDLEDIPQITKTAKLNLSNCRIWMMSMT